MTTPAQLENMEHLRRQADTGVRALNYVKDEIRHLTAEKSRGNLTREGEHAILVFRTMLHRIWRKDYRDGAFVFLDAERAA
jgi:hypothetical protein